MFDLKHFEVWFVTGSQHLYGPKTLERVADHSRQIAAALNASPHIPVQVVFKPVLTTPDAIRQLCLEANSAVNGVTSSPRRGGLRGAVQGVDGTKGRGT